MNATIVSSIQWKLCLHTFRVQHTHTHIHLTALFPGLPGWAGTRKAKPIWILLKQETVSGTSISCAICKSAPSSRQITTPAPHHSIFYRPDALPATQPTVSKHWRPEYSMVAKCNCLQRPGLQWQSWLKSVHLITILFTVEKTTQQGPKIIPKYWIYCSTNITDLIFCGQVPLCQQQPWLDCRCAQQTARATSCDVPPSLHVSPASFVLHMSTTHNQIAHSTSTFLLQSFMHE